MLLHTVFVSSPKPARQRGYRLAEAGRVCLPVCVCLPLNDVGQARRWQLRVLRDGLGVTEM